MCCSVMEAMMGRNQKCHEVEEIDLNTEFQAERQAMSPESVC